MSAADPRAPSLSGSHCGTWSAKQVCLTALLASCMKQVALIRSTLPYHVFMLAADWKQGAPPAGIVCGRCARHQLLMWAAGFHGASRCQAG